MIYRRKLHGLSVAETWFYPTAQKGSCVIYSYNCFSEPITLHKGEHLIARRDAQTLVSDLTLSPEELLKCCTSGVRNEIRRAEKDGVVCELFFADALKENHPFLRQFDAAYMEMHRQKNMLANSVYDTLLALANADALAVSVAKINDAIVAYHTYILGNEIARLLHSVSIFRGAEESSMRNAIGRGNRLLHYKDMLLLQQSGYAHYDWGGYATTDELASINAFKKSFGGKQQPRYYAMTTKSNLILFLYKLKNKVSKL